MNRFIALIFVVLCLFSVVSCKNNSNQTNDNQTADEQNESEKEAEPESDIKDEIGHISIMTGEGEDYLYNDEYEMGQAQIRYVTVKLDEDMSGKYPELAKTLSEENKKREEDRKETYTDLCESSQVHLDEEGSESFSIYESNETVYVRRADTKVLSLLYNYYDYTGGAHGNHAYITKNYDTKTGKLLKLSDVITDVSLLSEAVQKEIYSNYSADDLYENVDFDEYFANEETVNWLLDGNGISIFYNPYEISSYASYVNGVQIATIPYEACKEFANEEYFQRPASYTVELPMGTPLYYDIDNDGRLNEILLYSYEMEDVGLNYEFTIDIDGSSKELCKYSYGYNAMLVHRDDGKNYLYVECLLDNDYKQIEVFDISNGKVKNKGSLLSGYVRPVCDDSEYHTMKLVMTDPESFYLETRTDVLSTVFASASYHADENGIPVMDGRWFVFYDDGQLEFKMKRELSVDVVDEGTDEITGEKITLKKGEKVYYYRTDNNKTSDLMTEDGKVVRVTLSKKSWPRKIDGVNIEKIFKGLLFAG